MGTNTDTNTVIAAETNDFGRDKAIIIESSVVKRVADLLIAIVVSVSILPLVYLIVGLIIKLSSKGPIIFRQTRVGKNGELFCIYKFRTMDIDSDSISHKLIRPGYYLRTTHIDELPQMINVLKGEMSIVGPRPHTVEDTGKFSEEYVGYSTRLSVKPGITGLAQVSGYCGKIKSCAQLKQRIDADLDYIQNWSIWNDTIIIIKTIITNTCKCLGLY